MKSIKDLSNDELVALYRENNKKPQYEKAPTIGEDISNLWQGVKSIPGKAAEGGLSAAKHPGQALAGILPALGSAADIIPFAANTAMAIPEYFAEKYTGYKIPEEHKAERHKYYGTEFGTGIANSIAGTPQTEEEQQARSGGEFLSSLINPKIVTQKVTGKLTSLNPNKVADFKAAGINPTLGDVSDSAFIKSTQNAVQKTPLGNLRGVAREKQLDDFFKDIEPINILETGELTKSGAKAYNTKATQVANKLYDRAWKDIDKKAPIDMNNSISTIKSELDAITPEAREILRESKAGQALVELETAILSNEGKLPFDDVKNVFRGKLDDLINTFGEVGSKDQARLKRVYGAISEDMNKYVLEQNPKAARDLKVADKYWSDYSDKNRVIANKAIKQKKDTLTFKQLRGDLERGEVRPARVLTQRLSKPEKKQFTDTLINQQGKNAEGVFDAGTWANKYNKMTPEAQKISLSGMDREHAAKLGKVAKALTHVKDTKKFGNPSGTAAALQGIGAIAGLVYDPISTIKVAMGNAIAGEFFTNPQFINALYDASKGKNLDNLGNVVSKLGVQKEHKEPLNNRSIKELSTEELIKIYKSQRQ